MLLPNSPFRRHFRTILQVALASLIVANGLHAAEIQYGRDIRTILARRCYACHGPNKSEGGLRLDQHAGALAELESGEKAIVPGDTDASVLLLRVQSEDESERMPPEGERLTEAEVARLTQWISEGATWQDHWAFQPRTNPEIPRISNSPTGWDTHPMDAFIAQRLAGAGLQPAPPADRRALLRRATYDLTGLPPTFEEIEAFANDTDPQAYEKRIDQLLKSPHYGEKWGRHWLDLLRFAETNSFERDADKPHAYRFRDYVIQSLNDDKPMDQFIHELLAGDELPVPTAESRIATGFYRLGLWDDEPSDPEQLKYDILDDIVKTTSQVFLAMTMDCARCHDHKIDPILQRDYYQFVSFFANITPMQTRGSNIEQKVFRTQGEQVEFEAKVDRWNTALARIEARIRAYESAFALAVPPGSDLVPAFDLEALSYRYYEGQWSQLPEFTNLAANDVGAISVPVVELSNRKRNTDFGFVFDATLRVPEDGEYEFSAQGDEGYRLIIGSNDVISHAGGGGSQRPADIGTITLAAGRIPWKLEYFQGGEDFSLVISWRRKPSGSDIPWRTLTSDDIRKPSPKSWSFVQEHGEKVFSKELHAAYVKDLKRLEELAAEKPVPPMALCVTENASPPPPTHILIRGNPHVPGDEVEPAFPNILGGAKAEISANTPNNASSGRRTALAKWIIDPSNPLTARVLANRVFQYHFGRGIVRSANNFGLGGDSPTHPELLDWLAEQLVSNGWRLKPMHRLLMTSSAYKMGNQWNEAGASKDPTNNLLWRFDLRRLTAEELRDSFLAVNGSLNRKMFGPGFYPKMPDAVLQTQSMPGNGWGESTFEERSRRSIYIHVKRSLLTPLLESFDVAETDNSCPVRFVTTQPTQALGLLNSDSSQEQAELFAQRLRRECSDDVSRQVQLAYQRAIGRVPTAHELAESLDLISELQGTHQASQDEALRQFCLMLLNLNEFIYVD